MGPILTKKIIVNEFKPVFHVQKTIRAPRKLAIQKGVILSFDFFIKHVAFILHSCNVRKKFQAKN